MANSIGWGCAVVNSISWGEATDTYLFIAEDGCRVKTEEDEYLKGEGTEDNGFGEIYPYSWRGTETKLER